MTHKDHKEWEERFDKRFCPGEFDLTNSDIRQYIQ